MHAATARTRIWWLGCAVACVLGTLVGCGKKEPRYPQDHARFQRIDAAVDALRTAYADQNLASIRELILPFEKLERLLQEIQTDFDTFQQIDVEFSIDRIVIDGETVDVFVHWQGHWTRGPEDTGLRERGHGLLRFVGVQSILLRDVQGDLPFGMAHRLFLSGLIADPSSHPNPSRIHAFETASESRR